jgi:hypothetical protein
MLQVLGNWEMCVEAHYIIGSIGRVVCKSGHMGREEPLLMKWRIARTFVHLEAMHRLAYEVVKVQTWMGGSPTTTESCAET